MYANSIFKKMNEIVISGTNNIKAKMRLGIGENQINAMKKPDGGVRYNETKNKSLKQ